MVDGYLSRLLSITFGHSVIAVDAGVLAVALGDDGADRRPVGRERAQLHRSGDLTDPLRRQREQRGRVPDGYAGVG